MKPPSKKTVWIICGPTGVGKTGIAISLAKQLGTEIISADSRQCFKELRIGVARPSPGELAEINHHFIATHSIQEEVTAAVFEQYALQKVKELFSDHDSVVMAGGTGLYIRAFCEGLDIIPAIDPLIREKLNREYEEKGLGWLQEQVELKDPVFYKSGEIKNPQRVLRALEVLEGTGRSIFSFRKMDKPARDFIIKKIGLELPKEQLRYHIDSRVDRMMEEGLVEEVRSLLPFRHLNALQTVGYTEMFHYLDGDWSLEKAVEQIKTATRQYAKRQMTWFKKEEGIKWVSPENSQLITDILA